MHRRLTDPRTITLLVSLLCLLTPPSATARGRHYNHSGTVDTQHTDWMTSLPGGTSVAALSVPGTHDTMARYGGTLAETQSLELRKQLDAGIRALDVRCRHINDRFAIHHGLVYQNANFDDVLGITIQFLKDHPRETILMRVMDEYKATDNTRSFAQTFEWYRDQPAYKDFIWRGTHVPILDEVRGRIVILDDFPGGPYGVNWSSTQTQDDYVVPTLFDIDDKWAKVLVHLFTTNFDTSNKLFINFLSGSSSGAHPYTVAGGDGVSLRGVNDYVLEFLVAGGVQRTGILMMDFPGAGLIDAIIAHNFRLLPSSVHPQNDFDFVFQNVAHSFSGTAQERRDQMRTFIQNVLPGRFWHHVVFKDRGTAFPHHNGLFAAEEVDGYVHMALTTRMGASTLSDVHVQTAVITKLHLLSGQETDRAFILYTQLAMQYPSQSWRVVVKKTPGGYDNWAYTYYGAHTKISHGDYIYAVWGTTP